MGQIGRAMLKAGLVTEDQLKQAEEKAKREIAEDIVNEWKNKYGDNVTSQVLFLSTLCYGGLAQIKVMIKE